MSELPAALPVDHLRQSLPRLPTQLRAAGLFVVRNEFDAATRSMRDLAGLARLQPASFTRLAKALGYSGWEEFRLKLVDAQRPSVAGPFSRRAQSVRDKNSPAEIVVSEALAMDASGLRRIDVRAISRAAEILHNAPRIWIAGFRSCRSLALLMHYQLRLFRPDDVLLVGGTEMEDCDYGAFRESDAVILFGFQPYSQSGMLTRLAANAAGSQLVVVADGPNAPICEGAAQVLLFDAGSASSYFPSLTGAVAITQNLAAMLYLRGGENAMARLRQAEKRLSAMSQYVSEKE